MRSFIASLVAGLIFALGLGVGGMTDANEVIGFLNLAGRWDYGLALVIAGALLVTVPAYRVFKRWGGPLLGGARALPSGGAVDRKLLVGGALFGLGWGLGGFCPGPAVVSIATGAPEVLSFVAAMLAGMFVHDGLVARWARRRQELEAVAGDAVADSDVEEGQGVAV